ncbi:hypothetical protein SAMN05216345_111159 [Cupriavidus sp. YR651]|uniref:hypothetical protein n=1 Tax=Cupriavidus sp. YR651 TaxID=1855315 RepID=UPI00088D8836|nr:hypothetical protein [Cupriavidus sp. YR651]SDD58751.1 hypothetical protein SAMN05216345_111159 [Cupriavidus sp. YR651]
MHIRVDEAIQGVCLISLLATIDLVVRRVAIFWNNRPLTWRGRGTSKENGLDTFPLELNIERLLRQGLAQRVDQWYADARSGRTQLDFDDWLAGMALPGTAASAGIRIRQNDLSFVLRHGARYAIVDAARGQRVFECRIDGRLPIVAFVDGTGKRGPWLTIPRLFTIEEIVSMRELP